MKNVLVLLHDDEGQEARLQAALDLTRALSGHLMCLDYAISPELPADYFTGAGGAMVVEYAREREEKNRDRVEARLRDEDVSWSISDAAGALDEQLATDAELADIIVVSSPEAHDPAAARHIIGQVAVKADRPVLVVPSQCKGFEASGGALVAWNGTREANEALRAAVPLLQHASSVTLLELNNPDAPFAAQDAAAYLARHGVPATIIEESTTAPISDTVLDKAHEVGAAYVVLGAYGLPRVVEAVFGGVTDGMLRKSDIPLLLAH